MALFNLGETINPLLFSMGGEGNQAAVPPGFNPYAVQWANLEQANNYLKPYGLQVPTSLPRNFLFPGADTGEGFWGHHAKIANLLQSGLLNAAATPPPSPGGEGWGAGLSRAVQGALGGPEIQQKKAMEYFMAPFSMADTLSGLAARQAMNVFYQSYGQSAEDRALAEAQNNMARIQAERPEVLGANLAAFFNPDTNHWEIKEIPGAGVKIGSTLYHNVHTDPGSGETWGIGPDGTYGPIPGAPTALPTTVPEALTRLAYLQSTDPKNSQIPILKNFLQLNQEYSGNMAGTRAAATAGATGALPKWQMSLLNNGVVDFRKMLPTAANAENWANYPADQYQQALANAQTAYQNYILTASQPEGLQSFGAYWNANKDKFLPKQAQPGTQTGNSVWNWLASHTPIGALGASQPPKNPATTPVDPLGLGIGH